MKLLGYQISGQTVGIDLDGWIDSDLNGNQPFLGISDDATVPSGYTDISSIVNWGKFGGSAYCPMKGHLELDDLEVRKEIKSFMTLPQKTGDTTGLTVEEIETIKDYNLDDFFTIYEFFDHLPENTDVQAPPVDLDYNIMGLHKKRYFSKGELYKIEYYGYYDFATDHYAYLVLHEDRTYHRINEMVYRRELDICWHTNLNVSGSTKHTEKYYTQAESFAVGERRRRNCITNLKIGAVGLIMAVSGVSQLDAEQIGWAFLDEFQSEITVYVEGAQQFLLNAIATTTNHPWLDGTPAMLGGATVRQYLYSELDIDYTINNIYM